MHHISETVHHLIISFGTHMKNDEKINKID